MLDVAIGTVWDDRVERQAVAAAVAVAPWLWCLVLDRAAAAAFDVQLHRDLNWPFDVTGKKVMKATKMEPVPPGCLGSVY